MLEAIRNVGCQLVSKLHFGNVQITVASHQIAEREGLDAILDFAPHDSGVYETVELVVSREETARAILSSDEKDNSAVSCDTSRIIREDAGVTGSLYSARFYRVYNDFKIPGMNVVLPAFYLASEPDPERKHMEACGYAVFRSSLFVSILSSEETRYMLMINGSLTGGILTLYEPEITQDNISLEVKKVGSFVSYNSNNGKIAMKLDIKINVYFAEFPHDKSGGDNPVPGRVEKSAEKLVQENLRNAIKRLQIQYQSDALGMGGLIYRTNLPLWRQISSQWNEVYQTLPVDVTMRIYLANTAIVRE